MYVIGERINGMFNDVKAGIRDKDAGVIKDLAKRQVDGGANAIDINVGPASAEPAETIKWSEGHRKRHGGLRAPRHHQFHDGSG